MSQIDSSSSSFSKSQTHCHAMAPSLASSSSSSKNHFRQAILASLNPKLIGTSFLSLSLSDQHGDNHIRLAWFLWRSGCCDGEIGPVMGGDGFLIGFWWWVLAVGHFGHFFGWINLGMGGVCVVDDRDCVVVVDGLWRWLFFSWWWWVRWVWVWVCEWLGFVTNITTTKCIFSDEKIRH